MSVIQASYDTTFSTIRNVGTKDAGGALTPETTFNLTGKKGKLDLLTGSEQIVNEKRQSVETYRLFCDELDIVNTDFIKITAAPGSALINVVMKIEEVDESTLRGQNPHMEIKIIRKDYD